MFVIEVEQNPHLPEGKGRVEAILRIAAPEQAAPSWSPSESVEGLIIDVSGSMQGEKVERAKLAAEKAISVIDPSASFFVVSFSSAATVVWPLSKAGAREKADACARVRALVADGGTVMSRAMQAALGEVAKRPGTRAHVTFLTDGQNDDTDSRGELPAMLERCKGAFQADCRGVGTDWSTRQLEQVASALLGTAKIVAEPSGLELDFRDSILGSASRTLADVRIRLATPRAGGSKLAFLRQASPSLLDLTGQSSPGPDGTTEYRTGAWAPGERRDYHVAFDVRPASVDDEMLVCRPSVTFGRPEQSSRGKPVIAIWTKAGDERSALMNSHVAHYTGQTKLSEDIRQGLDARAKGDYEQATVLLGRALRSAKDSGNAEVTVRLRELVEERSDGTVAVKRNVAKAKVMDLDLSSVVTSRSKAVAPGSP